MVMQEERLVRTCVPSALLNPSKRGHRALHAVAVFVGASVGRMFAEHLEEQHFLAVVPANRHVLESQVPASSTRKHPPTHIRMKS